MPAAAIAYERVPDYWGTDIPVNRGRNNFDAIRYEYYRDANVALEAFKAGADRLPRREHAARLGHRLRRPGGREGPDHQAARSAHERPARHAGLRLQHAPRQCSRTRGCARRSATRSTSNGPTRTCSTGSTRAPTATSPTPSWRPRPARADELELLEPFRGKLPERGVHQEFKLPVTDGSGNNRENLRAAVGLLQGGRLGDQGRQARQ